MNHDSEKWLDDRISEDVDRMADKRIKELMESEELKDIETEFNRLKPLVDNIDVKIKIEKDKTICQIGQEYCILFSKMEAK